MMFWPHLLVSVLAEGGLNPFSNQSSCQPSYLAFGSIIVEALRTGLNGSSGRMWPLGLSWPTSDLRYHLGSRLDRKQTRAGTGSTPVWFKAAQLSPDQLTNQKESSSGSAGSPPDVSFCSSQVPPVTPADPRPASPSSLHLKASQPFPGVPDAPGRTPASGTPPSNTSSISRLLF